MLNLAAMVKPRPLPEGRYRVGFVEVTQDGTVGGSHQCLYDLTRHLDRARYDPVGIFYQDNDFAHRLRRAGIEVRLWPDACPREFDSGRHRPETLAGKAWRAVRGILDRVRFLRDARIDLVHLNNSPIGGLDDWLPAALWLGIPCIAHSRAAVARPTDPLRGFLLRRFARTIPVSRHIAATLEYAGIPPRRIRQVYDGIDLDHLRARIARPPDRVRAEFAVSPDGFLVAMVGNVKEWKGQHVLLAGLAAMPLPVRARTRALVVGDTAPDAGEYRARLERMVRELGLEGRVTFTGPRTDAAELMNAADVVVHASTIPEPFGLVVVEGMALGKPVVASALGGPAEIIVRGTGLLFDPERPAELAALLTRLAGDPGYRATLGRAGRSRAEDFGILPNVLGVERVYAGVLGLDESEVDNRIGAEPEVATPVGAGHVLNEPP